MSEEQSKLESGVNSKSKVISEKAKATTQKESIAKDKAIKAVKPKTKGRALTFVFCIVIFFGLGGLGYLYFEQTKAIDVIFTQQNEFVQTLALQRSESATELNSVQSNIEGLSQELNEQQLQANELLDEQKSELERINREVINTRLRINDSGSNNQVWTLAEAQSLLRLAGQRLIVAEDVRSALALMVAADDILKQINDPAIFSIRNILASDLAAVRAVEEIDVEGIYLQLGGLLARIDSSPLASTSSQQLESSDRLSLASDEDVGGAGFFARLSDSLFGSLDTYLVVRKTDEPIEPMLNAEEAFYIKEMIKLELEQARLGLLQGQEKVYYSGLNQALDNTRRYLEMNSQRQSIEETLERLSERPIKMLMPGISNSLLALQQIMPLSGQVGDEE